jgi:hypothetical protein
MNSRERIKAVLEGRAPDRVPLTTWCFGFPPPQHLRWHTQGREIEYWYTQRLEHIHTLPVPWSLEDEIRRAETWLSLGIDDVLEISVPWGRDPEAVWTDEVLPAGAPAGAADAPVMVRQYQTPSGPICHAVKKTAPEGPGWVLQPDRVPLFEDYNIPRAVRHAVTEPGDIPAVKHLYAPPGPEECRGFAQGMALLREAAEARGLFVQAWSAFGMDAVVWLTGGEGAVMLALKEPEAFARLLSIIGETDYSRTELAVRTPGVDMVCERGWYASTAFWSPRLFDHFVYPHVAELAALAPRHGKKFAFVMTTGVKILGPRLADAGVDLLYFVDPIQDRITLEEARDLLAPRMTLVGGTNALSLASENQGRIRQEVEQAVAVLGPTNRFILHPVDAIFPDTPWEGVAAMIEAWKTCH